jgi:sentrin-specific protease 1
MNDMDGVIDLTGEEPSGNVSSTENTSTDDHSGSVDATRLSLSAALRALYIRHVVPRYECENMLKPLTDEQNEKWDKATTSKTDSDVLVEKNSGKDYMCITVKDAKTLKPGVWLNDAIIDFALDDIARRAKNVCALRTQFVGYLYKNSGEYNYDSVKSWTTEERLGYDILNCDKIFIPVNQNRVHWVLVIVYLSSKKILYYDSLGESDVECTNNVVKWIGDVYSSRKNEAVHEWEVNYVSTPKQTNKYDCGVFVCKYAEYAALGCKIDFEESNMEYFRRRILIDALEAGSSEEGSRR